MKAFLLSATSSNEKSLNNFLKFLKKKIKDKKINIIKINRIKKNKKVLTVLKSPHVNKTAQEQFEIIKYSIRILLISKNFNKTIITIKKILNKIFNDIKLTLKYITNTIYSESYIIYFFKTINFKLNDFYKINVNKTLLNKQYIKHTCYNKKTIKLKTYLNIFNIYGETVI